MVNIKPVAKVNPRDLAADNKYYAQVVTTEKTDLKRLAYLVSNQSTVRQGDCYAVITSLLHNIIDELKSGHIVKLDQLGSFQLTVSSEGVETLEEVNQFLVKDVRLRFRPDKEIKKSLNIKTVDFKLVS